MLFERWDIKLPNENREEMIVNRIKEYFKGRCTGIKYSGIMLRNLKTLGISKYREIIAFRAINPGDALVYIDSDVTSYYDSSNMASHLLNFYYPLLGGSNVILNAFLSKLGFYYPLYVAPATGLKYVAIVRFYRLDYRYLTIELVDLDTVAKNTNLYDIVNKVLGDKLRNGEKELTKEEYMTAHDMLVSQKLFANHNLKEAYEIVYKYYDRRDQSLANEFINIATDYNKIFNRYKICFNRKALSQIDCLTIKFSE